VHRFLSSSAEPVPARPGGPGPAGDGGIPYSLSPGNRDTGAVCPGERSDPQPTYQLLRDTSTYNRYFARQSASREGAYERGKRYNLSRPSRYQSSRCLHVSTARY
jgi:hypothetical protein